MKYKLHYELSDNSKVKFYSTLKELKDDNPAMYAYYRWQKAHDGYWLFAGSMAIARVVKIA